MVKGYCNNLETTEAVINSDEWPRAGDMGVLDPQGRLMIADRKEHLFVSSGGGNITPRPIENLFLQSDFIDQFALAGNVWMLLTAMIVPEFEILKDHMNDLGIGSSREADIIKISEVRKLYEKLIQELQRRIADV